MSSSKAILSSMPPTRNKKRKQLHPQNAELFLNRELSWLAFNYRVLQEANRSKAHPLLERLKFLAIFEDNLIEFFMIRAAGLKQLKASSYGELQLDGRTPLETLQAIAECVNLQLQDAHRYAEDIYDNLAANEIEIVRNPRTLSASEKKFTHGYFHSELFGVLTPLAVGPGHPFPRISNARLNLVVTVGGNTNDTSALAPQAKLAKKSSAANYAIIEVPKVLPRFVALATSASKKDAGSKTRFIPIEEIIKLYLKELFGAAEIRSASAFTIIRNSELAIADEIEIASDNLLSTIEDELRNRRWGEVVCLHCTQDMAAPIKKFLCHELDLNESYEVYTRSNLLNLQDLHQLSKKLSAARKNLYYPPFLPYKVLNITKNSNDEPNLIFNAIRQKTYLLHHPYDSFQSVVDLIQAAARDPQVLAIKQTLYRIGLNSPFVKALIQAVENGKQVTALLEIKARFDEERNINWAREMENHGVHVVYGLVGLKVHAKILQIVRREEGVIHSYTHLSTGNYNPATAKLYTDISIITADPILNHDIAKLFHAMTGATVVPRLQKIVASPINLRYFLLRCIQNEVALAEKSKAAHIHLKMNALVDPEMIVALYRASCAGVKIDLNVRGICCLRPGLQGISENIRVHSVVGRFLEHSRIFYFANSGKPRVFLSSADWMPRNLNRRVEILFPIEDTEHIQYLKEVLDTNKRDTYNTSELQSDGAYRHLHANKKDKSEKAFATQHFFCEQAHKKIEQRNKQQRNARRAIFQPLNKPA